MRARFDTLAGLAALLLAAQPPAAGAAELKIGTARAIANVLERIGPQFELATGHRLDVISALPAQYIARMNAGERFDVLVMSPPALDALIKDGRILADSRTPLARSGIGMEVKAGAPKPDIGTVDAFKRTLLDAKSVAYLKVGSGLHIASVIERLGIADAVKAKTTRPDTDIVSELVARGEVEIGMVVITQIVTTPGVELVGPLPPELQSTITFTAGVTTNSAAPDAARALIRFLTEPAAAPVIKSLGMEPASP